MTEELDLGIDFKTTEEIEVPKRLIDQVIGQERAKEIIKLAAKQRRHVLLIGEPGTGKSMLGKALAELLPAENLSDIVAFYNPKDPNHPIIKEYPAGEGKKVVEAYKRRMALLGGLAFDIKALRRQLLFIYLISMFFIAAMIYDALYIEKDPLMRAAKYISANLIIAAMISVMFTATLALSSLRAAPPLMQRKDLYAPKLLIDNSNRKHAPFVDATGLTAPALLGDVLHDPYQSGGLETPAHQRLVPGAIHKAHKGVLFIDEIGTIPLELQIELLTAMQEKKYPISGKSEKSAGAIVQSDPVPCDFILVAAGTPETIAKMHPALRSRIRGYGYEVYMDSEMPDTVENRRKLVQFVAQEVVRDGKIPHFTKEAVIEIVKEAQKLAGRKGYLTLRLRELGGLVRAAGDIAKRKGHKYVTREDVLEAKEKLKTLEKQMSEKLLSKASEYLIIINKGAAVGRVNGLAVLGYTETTAAGLVLPIEAVVAPAMKKGEGRVIATGRLGETAKEAVQNASAIIKRVYGVDIRNYDIHIQFIHHTEAAEGDSASISVATAVISALFGIPVRQDTAMTGSLSIHGEVLPVGGINAKIEAAVKAGIKRVIIPKANEKDIMLPPDIINKVEIIPVRDLAEVLENALVESEKTKKLVEKIKKEIEQYSTY